MSKPIDEMTQAVTNLMCCGNCLHNGKPDCPEIRQFKERPDSCNYCWRWKWDKLANEQRRIEVDN